MKVDQPHSLNGSLCPNDDLTIYFGEPGLDDGAGSAKGG